MISSEATPISHLKSSYSKISSCKITRYESRIANVQLKSVSIFKMNYPSRAETVLNDDTETSTFVILNINVVAYFECTHEVLNKAKIQNPSWQLVS